jgi:hypothetical protein
MKVAIIGIPDGIGSIQHALTTIAERGLTIYVVGAGTHDETVEEIRALGASIILAADTTVSQIEEHADEIRKRVLCVGHHRPPFEKHTLDNIRFELSALKDMVDIPMLEDRPTNPHARTYKNRSFRNTKGFHKRQFRNQLKR